MDIKRVTLTEQHYLYVERIASFEPASIAEAMGSGFGELMGLIAVSGITPISMPSAVYVDMPVDNKMPFRAAIFVTAEDISKANDVIKAANIPAGDAYTATHFGSYAGLGQSHNTLWGKMDADGVERGDPVWEVYVDDPTTVAEADCRTEIYRAIG